MTKSTPVRPKAPAAFHVMLKPRGAICNLECEYCFYLDKEALFPQSRFRMREGLLEEFTRQYIAAQRVPEVTFAWQGGEPTLMGLDFFRRAVDLQHEYRRPGMRILNAMQTNGTLLDDEWCRFFRAHEFLIGLSLDGPRDLHDAYRRDKGGQPTFDRVMAGASLLQKHRVQFNILTCVHPANAGRPLEVYRFLRDGVQAQFIQFIPIVERANDPGPLKDAVVTDRSVTGRQYGDFLIAIFDEWVRQDVGRVFVQGFDVALAAWVDQRPGLCVFEETCGLALAMEHNGDLYACDHFVEPRLHLGNILDAPLVELVGSEQQRRFGLDKQKSLPHVCRQCEVLFACNGGCPKNRLLHTKDGEPGLNYLCEGYLAFFRHIDRPMQIMAREFQSGQSPANIMRYLAQEEAGQKQRVATRSRSAPCPCGSGRKYKHCCGRTPARTERSQQA
jgi:uncharacterized protein